ncbi:RNA polymerase sigma factor sigA [Morus notabilis]|uniref:RNA polymerase sigma factor sigA n=1 Tax=Morus notabilis TaxID=981085 RepID=UPI000CED6381|nr:RNA polymerase sigma factor sigA [Morus notabilis]XP_024021056.1 RNA polymerase sigma factor sigA [Morus notabilis]
MMATAAVIGLGSTTTTGKRVVFSSSSYYSDGSEKLSSFLNMDHSQFTFTSANYHLILSRKSSNYTTPSSRNHQRSIRRALKEHLHASSAPPWLHEAAGRDYDDDEDDIEEEEEEEEEEEGEGGEGGEEEEEGGGGESSAALGHSVDALLLLQKSMLEKQWNLSFNGRRKPVMSTTQTSSTDYNNNKPVVTCSGVSARHRRKRASARNTPRTPAVTPTSTRSTNDFKGYLKGVVGADLLTHAEVVRLSKKIKIGLSLEDHKSRLRERLGCEPSDKQLATSLRISRAELHSKMIESSLAREKLAMSNVRLVMSIAQRYDNMGAEMADLVQGGLIGLLRGIEKFDSSKGFKISTYVYWWIRQGVSRALVENSRTLRLPTHLHERLSSIRNAKIRLQEKGITPSIDRIAECLNMSKKKVRNATEAISKVFSLDREAFPSLNGLPGETHHSYIADNCSENIPWHGVDEWALKEEVNKLINTTLGERETDIIRLYYGLDNECLTWEDISKRIGLSRERVRQVGLVALEKLKHAARRKQMEAMLVKH